MDVGVENKVTDEVVEHLTQIFEGKTVVITSTGNRALTDGEGICKTFHNVDGKSVDIELTNGQRYGLVPEIISQNSIEGNLGLISGRREIRIKETA